MGKACRWKRRSPVEDFQIPEDCSGNRCVAGHRWPDSKFYKLAKSDSLELPNQYTAPGFAAAIAPPMALQRCRGELRYGYKMARSQEQYGPSSSTTELCVLYRCYTERSVGRICVSGGRTA